jgi:hypothetical protein
VAPEVKETTMSAEDEDLEFLAMRQVYASLKDLDVNAQNRVLDYVTRRLSLTRRTDDPEPIQPSPRTRTEPDDVSPESQEGKSGEADDVEGISPIALKWMRRSQLSGKQLSILFSLGIEEIDLVAKAVPGKSKAERVKSIALLLGIAGYLSSGAARFTDEKLREACGHYNAYDGTNFSKHLRAISAEVAGTKENGYALSSRGLTEATELIKAMLTGG